MRKNTIKNAIFRTDLTTQSYLKLLINNVNSVDDKSDSLLQ